MCCFINKITSYILSIILNLIRNLDTSNLCHRIISKVLTFFDLKFLFLLWLHLSAHCRNSFHVLILICRSVLLSRKDCSAIKWANWHNGSNLPFDTSINQICSLYSLYVYLARIWLFLLFWFIWFWMDPLLLISKTTLPVRAKKEN